MTRRQQAAATERRRIEGASTELEGKLWRHLRRMPEGGGSFLRQERIGPYLADFLSDRLSLIIEVDGAQHDRPDNRAGDAVRDLWLAGEGYLVLRFPNEDVRSRLPGVLDTIRLVAEERRTAPSARRPRSSSPVQGKPRPRPR